MNRRMLVLGGLGLAGVGAGAWWWNRSPEGWSEPYTGEQRWASLSPLLTETMFAIGAGAALVGRTSECRHPLPARRIRNLGPPHAPDVEVMEKLRLDGVLAEQGTVPLSVDDAVELPWGTVEEAAASTRELGERFGVTDRAEVLAAAFEKDLAAPEEPPTGARTLVLFGMDGDQANFVARNTLRGRAVTAAGLRPAVDRDFDTDPTIALADLPSIEPEVVILLVDESIDTAQREALLEPLRAITGLAAVQSGSADVIGAPGILSRGPSLLSLVPMLRTRVAAITGEG